MGSYFPEVLDELETKTRDAGFRGKGEGGLRHTDSVDAIKKQALNVMRAFRSQLSDERNFIEAWSSKDWEKVRDVTSLVDMEGAMQ